MSQSYREVVTTENVGHATWMIKACCCDNEKNVGLKMWDTQLGLSKRVGVTIETTPDQHDTQFCNNSRSKRETSETQLCKLLPSICPFL